MSENKLMPENWVKNYSSGMYKYLLFRVKYKEVAEDLVQETFISALNSLASFSGNSSEKTWLYAIMKFKLADYYRKHYKNTPAENNADEAFLGDYFDLEDEKEHWFDKSKPQAWHSDVEDVIEKKEFQQTLDDCVKKVPTKTASVFTLKYLEDQSSKEICDILEISEANLWTLMHRAKLMLRACLEQNWFVKA
ncbi:MAG: hypothetical protein RLZZ175_1623 [Bacteroidota bacterium]|jgi:RNA polymerase sigma-70 factor (TIGR02943 family)